MALAEATQATFLVSGDRDLLTIERGGVSVRTPREVLSELEFRHPWGQGLLPGRFDEALRQVEAEGHDQVFKTVSVLLAAIDERDAVIFLPAIVTPELLDRWIPRLSEFRQILADRGVASRPEYPTPDVAYVKLPKDPGELVRSYSDKLLEEAVIVGLLHFPWVESRGCESAWERWAEVAEVEHGQRDERFG